MHCIYGEPEALSCYSSGSNSDKPSEGVPNTLKPKSKKLPEAVQRTLADVIRKKESSSAKGDSSSAMSGDSSDNDNYPSHVRAAHLAPAGLHFEDGLKTAVDRPSKEGPRTAVVAPVHATQEEQPVQGGESPSAAEKHFNGECKPCIYVTGKVGCRNGDACKFCHFPHKKQFRPRPCKATRVQCKQIADMLEAHVDDPEERMKFSELLGPRTPYTKLVLQGKQRLVKASEGSGDAVPNVPFVTDTTGPAGRADTESFWWESSPASSSGYPQSSRT